MVADNAVNREEQLKEFDEFTANNEINEEISDKSVEDVIGNDDPETESNAGPSRSEKIKKFFIK